MDLRHNRRSLRLRAYNYASPGAYFVTICTHDHACLFGNVVNDAMHPNDAGRMVETVFGELSAFYPGVDTEGFVLMPNHIHGIVTLVGATPRGRPDSGQAHGPAPTVFSLADVVHRFKTMTTKRYADGVKQSGWEVFRGRLWQRNYYERVIRDADELDRIRLYIAGNPARWSTDTENPANTTATMGFRRGDPPWSP